MRINDKQPEQEQGKRISTFNQGFCVRLVNEDDNCGAQYYLTMGNAEAVNLRSGILRSIRADDRFIHVNASIVIHS